MQYQNALETYPLYDSILIGSNAPGLYKNAGYFADYAELGQPAMIPFFNVRNKAQAGKQYNNFDSANKLSFVYHCHSIGLSIEAPAVSFGSSGAPGEPAPGNLFFATELVKHCGFILKIGQDEKLVAPGSLMPSGQGVAGYADNEASTGDIQKVIQNTNSGDPELKNRFPFAEPLEMPRESNVEGQLIISEYGREALKKMVGPGNWEKDQAKTEQYPAMAVIRVTLFGEREVQQRNAQHFS
jgi:hypothetical protein